MMAWIVLIALLCSACRATPIPVTQRYPAGTAFQAHYLTLDGTRIRYIDAGRGVPVIFLHGLGASVYAWRKNLAPVESAGFRVIAFDNRGFGSSEKPATGYSNEAYAHLVTTLMDSLELPDAVLVGHSMGGAIAAEVAIAFPRRVRGLVLIDAAGAGVRRPVLLHLAGLPLLVSAATQLRGRWVTGAILKSTYSDPSKVGPNDVDQYYAPVAEPEFGRSLRAVLREFRFDALLGRLGGLDVPALAVWGERDRWVPPRLGKELAAELHRVAYVQVGHAGHSAQEEAPEEVNRLLIAFLKEAIAHVPANLAVASPRGVR